MNEQLQQALAEMLNKASAGIDAGSSFLMAELPEVIQQLLIWKASVSALSMVAFFALAYFIYKFNAMQFKWMKKVASDQGVFDPIDHPQMMFNLFQIFLLLPLCGLWSITWLQIWLAPKIYLIEYAASLAK